MRGAKTSGYMSTGLQRVAERARRNPHERQFALAHLIDVDALGRAYSKLRKDAAVGVDGVTKEEYGEDLEDNLQALHSRLKAGRYRHQPIRRVYIPKADGKKRPIGISTVEDKLVQKAVHEIVEAIFEQDFLDCSHGFRPGRSAHDALRAVGRAARGGWVDVILEADIESFFGSLDRSQLKEMLQKRIADKSLMRLVGKCLHVGVLDDEEFSRPDGGTTQGSSLSPLLGNVYLHYVLDVWFEHEVKPRLKGRASLVRYADDFVIGFERMEDAEAVMRVLPKRFARLSLNLHPDKTRLLDFRRPPIDQTGGKGPGTFDFLGFTLYWRRNARGPGWHLSWKTRKARLSRAVKAVWEWCRDNRHLPIPEQHKALTRRIRGHFNYFGVNDNQQRLKQLLSKVERAWFRWLRRRSHRSRLTWQRFNSLLKDYPLPPVRVYKELWTDLP